MRGVNVELCYVGGKAWKLLCGAAGSCAEREESEVA